MTAELPHRHKQSGGKTARSSFTGIKHLFFFFFFARPVCSPAIKLTTAHLYFSQHGVSPPHPPHPPPRHSASHG